MAVEFSAVAASPTTLLAIGAGSLMTAVVASQMPDLPLDKVLQTGGFGVMLTMCWLFLKQQNEQRKEHNATIEKVASQHSATVERVTSDFSQTQRETAKTFADTTQSIMRENREREMQLHQIIREKRPD